MEGDVLAGEVAADLDDGIGGVEVLMGGAGERKADGIGDEERFLSVLGGHPQFAQQQGGAPEGIPMVENSVEIGGIIPFLGQLPQPISQVPCL